MLIESDELIERISLWNEKKPHLFAYKAPFGVVWAISFAIWCQLEFSYDLGVFICGITIMLQTLLWLSTVWSCRIRCFIECVKSDNIYNSTLIRVKPMPNNGDEELVKLRKRRKANSAKPQIYFTFQKVNYYFEEECGLFQTRYYELNSSIAHYATQRGIESETHLMETKEKFEQNEMVMELPEFKVLFMERATAPFFVFQVFCVGLWCLDEYWYYSLFTLFMLVMFEMTLVKQQMRNMKEIRNMGNKPYHILCYRFNKWVLLPTDKLLPGDIVSLKSSIPAKSAKPVQNAGAASNQRHGSPPPTQSTPDQSEKLSPCDLLLLSGRLICDEALLTGESVPQVKEGIDQLDQSIQLDVKEHQVSFVSGGTKILQHISPASGIGPYKPTDKGCPALVVRTGFSTTQGSLLRTILYGSKRVTANNAETGLFILILLSFAIAAASYLWVEATKNPERSRYKLLLECTFILTSVVPPELPIQLSLAVNSSLLALSKLGLFCTEPFRIPYAGKVDIVCFDKTGTLTQDKLVVQGVAGLDETDPDRVLGADELGDATLRVLAGAHALHMSDEKQLIGDPLEIAIMNEIKWTLKGDHCSPLVKSKVNKNFKIEKKFHFSSARARMSTLVSHEAESRDGAKYTAVIKGSAEALKPRLVGMPEWYDRVHKSLARQGHRVLALASKPMHFDTRAKLVLVERDEVESELTFRGFLVTGSPLKGDTCEVIRELRESSHYVTMITGDAALTAIHVAKTTAILPLDDEQIFTLERETSDTGGAYFWRNLAEASRVAPLHQLPNANLCVTGSALTVLMANEEAEFVSRLMAHVRVFARVSPRQKELIILELKERGFNTVMCGDGTNDVGALRHSHVGVALLASSVGEKLEKQREFIEKKRQVERMMRYQQLANRGQPPGQPAGRNNPRAELDNLMKELEEMDGPQVVQLGDASIAAPFTSRNASPAAVLHVIRQGRCTLVTTLQMFSILALNSLISAYSQSALYLKGIKFSDGQYTLLAFLIAGCFLFISRAEPLKKLSTERPLPNIFNLYSVLTVLSQFAVHFYCLYSVVKASEAQVPPSDDVDLEAEFEKSLLNSAVYIISLSMQVNTLAVNYRGAPFMTSLNENRPLLYSLGSVGLFSVALAGNLLPDVSAQFDIINFPSEFSDLLTRIVLFDFVGAFGCDRVLRFLFGFGSLRHIV